MASLQGFDANQHEVLPAFEPLPAGRYMAVITASELKATKAGTGQYLQLNFEVTEGDCKGRRVYARLNLSNPNPVAAKIGQAELASVCRAVGILTPNDSTELHDLPLVIDVKCQKRADNGEITNEIKAYHPKAAAAKPVAATSTVPPWKR